MSLRTIPLPFLIGLLMVGTVRGQHPAVPAIDPLSPDPQPFDILHYAPTLDLRDAPARTMRGVCTITFLWRRVDEPIFRFNLRDLEIDSIRWQSSGSEAVRVAHETIGRPADAEYHHQLAPPDDPSVGDTVEVTIWYHGTMTDELGPGRWGGVSSSNNVLYAMGVGFSNNYVSATQHWMPCYDHPSDKATFTGRFRIPSDRMVASNGLVVERIDEGDGTTTWVWDHVYPAATYLLTFAVAPYTEIDLGTPELPMLIYTLPSDSAATRRSFSQLPKMVGWYAEHFGDYPFEKVGYANTPQGAMEHQTMVSFPTFLSRTGDSLNLTGAHELAHQWFGDLVSPVDFRHAWLNESFATFCEALWLEAGDGEYSSYLSGINGNLLSYFGSDVVREGVLPLYDFSREPPSSNYPATIYNKGAVVVGMLRYELGETRFFEAMRRYLQTYAYGVASTEELIGTIGEVTGRDLGWFFDQWVYGKGWPIFEVEGRPGEVAGTERVIFRQVQPPEYGTYTGVSFEMSLVTATGTQTRLIRVDSAEQSFVFDVEGEVLELVMNQGPNVRSLAQFSVELLDVPAEQRRYSGLLYSVRSDRSSGWPIIIERRKPLAPGAEVRVSVYDTNGRLRQTETAGAFPVRVAAAELESGHYMIVLEEGTDRQVVPAIIRR